MNRLDDAGKSEVKYIPPNLSQWPGWNHSGISPLIVPGDTVVTHRGEPGIVVSYAGEGNVYDVWVDIDFMDGDLPRKTREMYRFSELSKTLEKIPKVT